MPGAIWCPHVSMCSQHAALLDLAAVVVPQCLVEVLVDGIGRVQHDGSILLPKREQLQNSTCG